MTDTNTGGPAFPNEGFNGWGKPQEGMTLRDYFAGKAMQAVLTSPILMAAVGSKGGSATQHIAKQSYEMADAMIKARSE